MEIKGAKKIQEQQAREQEQHGMEIAQIAARAMAQKLSDQLREKYFFEPFGINDFDMPTHILFKLFFEQADDELTDEEKAKLEKMAWFAADEIFQEVFMRLQEKMEKEEFLSNLQDQQKEFQRQMYFMMALRWQMSSALENHFAEFVGKRVGETAAGTEGGVAGNLLAEVTRTMELVMRAQNFASFAAGV